MQTLKGVIESVIYRNDDNGWTVLELMATSDMQVAFDEVAQRTSRSLVVAVGVMPLATAGAEVELTGGWTEHKNYGRQFKFESAILAAPEGEAAVEKYLASGLIKGVREATAKNIVRRFGDEALAIIEKEPERLSEIKGISLKRAREIGESYARQKEMRDVVMLLIEQGLTANQSVRLYKRYGPSAPAVILQNPYRLIDDIDGIGFKTADKIAHGVGIGFDSPFRIAAGLKYALNTARTDGGHTCLPFDRLCAYAADLLGCDEQNTRDRARELIDANELKTRDFGDGPLVFLPYLLTAEEETARILKDLAEAPETGEAIDARLELAALEESLRVRLDETQRRAVLEAVEFGVMVITGGPGTGKTTIMEFVLALMDKMGFETELCAPTGRAAKRLSEATGRDAKTIHRMLEYNGDTFGRDADNMLDADVYIVDEASMIDSVLMHRLLLALPEGARILLVGDADQLPSVGAGNVLRDIIKSDVIPVVRLTEIFRQSRRSRIAENAKRVNEGLCVLTEFTDDFGFEERGGQENVLERVVGMLKNGRLGDAWEDVQILSPTKKGAIGVKNINVCVQEALNPAMRGKREKPFGDMVFRVGDKVMQTKNNYKMEWTKPGVTMTDGAGVYNGDMGTVVEIHEDEQLVEILFDDERTAFYDYGEMSELELAYCISIHKSQGSEFPVVILPLCGGPPQLMTRNLLYTALTRARERVVIVGRIATVNAMIANNDERTRYSALADLLMENT